MAKISFKVKPVREIMPDNSDSGVHILYVPNLDRKHCDMGAFRSHPKYGGWANSDMFKGILARIRKEFAPFGWIRTDAIPANVSVDRSGFLWVVTVDV